MKSNGVPTKFNLILFFLFSVLNVFQWFILPLFLLPLNSNWALMVVPLFFFNNNLWSLIHESVHSGLHPNRFLNDLMGRTLSFLFGASYSLLGQFHLTHHKLNRTKLEIAEGYDPNRKSKVGANLKYFYMIFGGMYLNEIRLSIIFLLPKNVRNWISKRYFDGFTQETLSRLNLPQFSRSVRIEGFLVLLFWIGVIFSYQENIIILLSLVLSRAFCISFLDNIYHYQTPALSRNYAMNLYLPKLASRFLLNFNFHHVHHEAPSLSWRDLPNEFCAEKYEYKMGYFRAAAAQLRGVIPF